MTMRAYLVLALAACCFAEAGWSQDLPPPPAAPDVGPALSAPPSNGMYGAAAQPAQTPYSSPPSGYSPQPAVYPQYAAPAAPPVYAQPPGPVVVVPAEPYPYVPHARPLVLVPAPPMSSDEWIAGIDALFLERNSGGSIPLGYSVYNRLPGLPPAVPPDNLYSDDATFPLAAGVRLELSRKITDYVTLSATYWGLQQWSVSSSIYGDPDNYTVLAFSPYLQLPTLLNGLDNSLGYTYSSQVENVELNALFHIGGDSSYWHLDWLWGARYVNLGEQFALTGQDIYNSAEENLSYSTKNNLIGVQTGLLYVHGWSRFQWETGFKVGLMANIYSQHGTDTASTPSGAPAGFVPYDVSSNGTGLSALFEVSIAAKFRLTDLLWLRLGYQFYDITGLALAPRQLNAFGHGGNVALDGLSIGLEARW